MQGTNCTNNHADDEFAVVRNSITDVVRTAREVAPHFAPIDHPRIYRGQYEASSLTHEKDLAT